MNKKAAYTDNTLINLANKRSVNLKVAMFPGKYVQGGGALLSIGELISPLGSAVYIFGGKRALGESLPAIKGSLENSGIAYRVDEFSGKSTQKQIDSATTNALDFKADIVLGVGGGQAIDAAKAVAEQAGIRVAVIPTIASTDAPTSTISVVYDEKGAFSHYLRFAQNPDLVVVDTEIIAKAPPRFFAAGIGGALAVSYEAEAAYKSSKNNMVGGVPFESVILWAIRCRQVIFEYGVIAHHAVNNKLVTPAVESIVEVNLLLSGIGFESGGLAAAHGVFHGFRSVVPEHGILHGEYVSFGTLVQVVLENRPEKEIRSLFQLFKELRLPYRLEHLGIDNAHEENLVKIAAYACEAGTTPNMPFSIDRAMMLDAIMFVDSMGKQY